MRYCEVDQNKVDCSAVTVDFHSFGKALSPQYSKAYRLVVDFAGAATRFSAFYQSFVEREAEDEGFEEDLEGDYLRLRETGYLSFERMLSEQPELLSSVLLRLLPSEFIGYLFRQRETENVAQFALQTLTNVSIADGLITCEGESFVVAR